jgi:hypothetical protein
MRRCPILLLVVGLVLLAGLPADRPAMADTTDADTLTLDPTSPAPLHTDALLAAWPAKPWTGTLSRSCSTGDSPSVWSRSRAVLPTLARAPPRLRSA